MSASEAMGKRVAAKFFGRERELEALLGLGDGLTLVVGLPGVGKTRLVRTAAQRVARTRQVCWVDASTVRDASSLTAAIARALQVSAGAAQPAPLLAEVADALERSAAVLVLDELEHLGSEGASLAVALSEGAPAAAVWCTSRERFGAGERVLEVKPLEAGDASALFVEQFRRAASSRRLDPDVARQLAAATDGLPLALELVAVKAAAVGPVEALAELRARGARARTLDVVREAVASVLFQLAPGARQAFAAASVFEGGFDVHAARAVLPLPDNHSPLDLLNTLCSASLLTTDDGEQGTRFGMLTLLRASAEDALAAEPDLAARSRARHAAHFAAVTAAARPDHAETWAMLSRERANLWRAFRNAAEPAQLTALAVAFERLLLVQGPAAEHEQLLREALARAPGPELECAEGRRLAVQGLHLRAMPYFLAAHARSAESPTAAALCCYSLRALGELDRAQSFGEEALARAHRLDEPRHVAYAETMLGTVAQARGQLDLAAQHHLRAAAAASAPRTPRLLGIVLGNLTHASLELGDLAQAREAHQAACEAYRETGERRAGARIAALTGQLLHREGRTAEARAVLDAALPTVRDLMDLEAEADISIALARVCLAERKTRQARHHLERALSVARRTDYRLLQQRAEAALAEVVAGAEALVLAVSDDASELTLPSGVTLDLSRRRQLRAVLLALVQQHRAQPGTTLTVDALLARAWPGQRMVHESGLARVYMTVRRLRELGLEEVLLTRDDGYCLDPHLTLRRRS